MSGHNNNKIPTTWRVNVAATKTWTSTLLIRLLIQTFLLVSLFLARNKRVSESVFLLLKKCEINLVCCSVTQRKARDNRRVFVVSKICSHESMMLWVNANGAGLQSHRYETWLKQQIVSGLWHKYYSIWCVSHSWESYRGIRWWLEEPDLFKVLMRCFNVVFMREACVLIVILFHQDTPNLFPWRPNKRWLLQMCSLSIYLVTCKCNYSCVITLGCQDNSWMCVVTN